MKATDSVSWISTGWSFCPRCKENIEPEQEICLRNYKTNDAIEHVSCKWKKKGKGSRKRIKKHNMTPLHKDKRDMQGGLPSLGKRR